MGVAQEVIWILGVSAYMMMDFFKPILLGIVSVIIPVFIGLELVDRIDIYWAIFIPVLLGNFVTWWFSENYYTTEFFELPEDMKGKSYEEIREMVEEDGKIIHEIHNEFLRNAHEQGTSYPEVLDD